MSTPMPTLVYLWHFTCPECGFGDQEFGRLAEVHDVHCEVCILELDRPVRLRRWPADEAAHAAAEPLPLPRTREAA